MRKKTVTLESNRVQNPVKSNKSNSIHTKLCLLKEILVKLGKTRYNPVKLFLKKFFFVTVTESYRFSFRYRRFRWPFFGFSFRERFYGVPISIEWIDRFTKRRFRKTPSVQSAAETGGEKKKTGRVFFLFLFEKQKKNELIHRATATPRLGCFD